MTDITKESVAGLLPRRPDNAHKGTMGTLCAVTGSYGFSGAAVLSAKAALRSGVGLLYQVIPESIYPIFASSVHESVCVPVRGSLQGTVAPADTDTILNIVRRATAVLIGCGMGNTSATAAVLRAVVCESGVPVVIDADGINALSKHIDILNERKAELILTPHIKEFSRLSGLSVSEIIDRQEQVARDFSLQRPDITLVLKSHRTVIARNGETFRNTAGNSGMAKGGSGDVLAGIIASLAAQGCAPFDAAIAGVSIHAAAGDAAAEKLGKTAMLPSDIIDHLADVFIEFEKTQQ